ncbi:hypothetical protein D3C86_2147710 [compost metagenome]
MAPASVSALSVPSAAACAVIATEAGAINNRVPLAILRPFNTSAAMRRSVSLAPVQAPM